VQRAFGDAASAHGRLDAVVLNAGLGVFARVDATGEEALRAMVETNLNGVVRCIREAVPWLRRARGGAGRIVLVSSVAGRRGFPTLGVYSATKWALHGLADALRVELAPDGIATSIVAPGRTDTEFLAAAARHGEPPPAPSGRQPPAPAERVADAIVRALETAPVVVYPGRPGFLIALANLLVPRWFDRRLG
jgi:NAD(P)-dependent dehydrogenase (short-subunit alcohol dehydrogenase family)